MLTLKVLSRATYYERSCIPALLYSQKLGSKYFSSESSSSSSSESDSDTEKKNSSEGKIENIRNESKPSSETSLRLNSLLKGMMEGTKSSKTINVAKPAKTIIPKKKDLAPKKSENDKPFEQRFTKAAQDIAKSLGGDVKKTEEDLLYKLLRKETAKPPTDDVVTETIMKKKSSKKTQEKEPEIPAIDTKQDLMNLLNDMKVAKDAPPPEMQEFDEYAMKAKRAKMYTQPRQRSFAQELRGRKSFNKWDTSNKETFDLQSGHGFNILKNLKTEAENLPKLTTWDALEQQELKMAVTHPPENYFQEMIQWTEKGMLWHFPINNEQGLESECDVHFSEHVFMEKHLQGWCPRKGPIRHFMELVCVGLSKNPYMTVEEKVTHINWYKNYFSEKEEILTEIGALPEGHTFGALPSKSTEQV